MAVGNKQIGWSQESNLLWQILNQLSKLTSIIFGLKPKYKVYTALLTQSGGNNPLSLFSGAVTKGVTYKIDGTNGDFSNVGAPNNNLNTSFVAINNEIPNNYGTTLLIYNTGAPVVTVLENTIGNIWFTYETPGTYNIESLGLFNSVLILYGTLTVGGGVVFKGFDYSNNSSSKIQIGTVINGINIWSDDYLLNTLIEIRVYN